MPVNGVLSQKTFFPRNGDVLDEDEISWACRRAHTYVDDKTGKTIRYALLVGRHASIGDKPIPRLVEDTALPLPMLRDIEVVHRPRGEGVVAYKRNEKGNYEEE